jgi:integrase
VDAVPLAKVTPAAVEAWKLAFVASRSANDENKARSARNTANATLRSAKSLFSKRLLRFIAPRLELPSPLPFDGVEFYPRQSMRYSSAVNIEDILAKASTELATSDDEAFKAFLLCLFAGLRRNEADKLRWSSIDLEAGVIRIEAHEHFAPKAETSLGDIPLDAEVSAILRGMKAKAHRAEYVLAGVSPKTSVTWRPYRADETFARLGAWLKAQGVKSRTPLHTLRKEAGSLICQKERSIRRLSLSPPCRRCHYCPALRRTEGSSHHRALVHCSLLPAQNVIAADFKTRKTPAKSKKEARTA